MSNPKLTPAQHLARLGDHLSRVAAFYGFRSYAALWNEPSNARLRTERHNPNILAAGDPIAIPELAIREVDRSTEQRHRFRVQLPELVVRFEFQSWDGKPVKDAPKDVRVDGKPAEFTAPGSGKVEVPVTPLSDRCSVAFPKGEVLGRVGFLQPASTLAGQRQRLNNLGYDAGEANDPAELQRRSAVEEFQCDRGLLVDGKCGPKTQAALQRAHGC